MSVDKLTLMTDAWLRLSPTLNILCFVMHNIKLVDYCYHTKN